MGSGRCTCRCLAGGLAQSPVLLPLRCASAATTYALGMCFTARSITRSTVIPADSRRASCGLLGWNRVKRLVLPRSWRPCIRATGFYQHIFTSRVTHRVPRRRAYTTLTITTSRPSLPPSTTNNTHLGIRMYVPESNRNQLHIISIAATTSLDPPESHTS